MIPMDVSDLVALVTAAGALGGAAFGIVEGLKSTPIGTIGFKVFKVQLGVIWTSLSGAYGSSYESLLEAQYQGNHDDLLRTLRQGVRIGLTAGNAKQNAKELGDGLIDGQKLENAATKIHGGQDLTPDEQHVLSRYELAVDARIDAAMTLALNKYAESLRIIAMLVALRVALGVGWLYSLTPTGLDDVGETMLLAAIVGIAAVPLAPIAKDLATAIQAAAQATGKLP